MGCRVYPDVAPAPEWDETGHVTALAAPGVQGSGVRVRGVKFRVWGVGFRVWGLGFGVWDEGCMVGRASHTVASGEAELTPGFGLRD